VPCPSGTPLRNLFSETIRAPRLSGTPFDDTRLPDRSKRAITPSGRCTWLPPLRYANAVYRRIPFHPIGMNPQTRHRAAVKCKNLRLFPASMDQVNVRIRSFRDPYRKSQHGCPNSAAFASLGKLELMPASSRRPSPAYVVDFPWPTKISPKARTPTAAAHVPRCPSRRCTPDFTRRIGRGPSRAGENASPLPSIRGNMRPVRGSDSFKRGPQWLRRPRPLKILPIALLRAVLTVMSSEFPKRMPSVQRLLTEP